MRDVSGSARHNLVGGETIDRIGIEFSQHGAADQRCGFPQCLIFDPGDQLRNARSHRLDPLIDRVIVFFEPLHANNGFRSQVVSSQDSCTVRCQLVLSEITALFKLFRDLSSDLFADLLLLFRIRQFREVDQQLC